jgi:hypothetical protein
MGPAGDANSGFQTPETNSPTVSLMPENLAMPSPFPGMDPYLEQRPGPNRLCYMTKRGEMLNSPAHFVEIDLLRGGPPMPAIDRPECVYSVLISRADGRPGAGFWAIALREPLPTVPIPLRTGEPDAHLDLRATLDRVYDEAGYRYFLYEHPPIQPSSARMASGRNCWLHRRKWMREMTPDRQ